MRDVFAHEVARFGEEFPRGREYRKYWEVAMAIMAFDAGGLLDGTRHFLGVGAGNEPTIFHLTRHAASVLATDLYLNEGWEESANSSMLTDPGRPLADAVVPRAPASASHGRTEPRSRG